MGVLFFLYLYFFSFCFFDMIPTTPAKKNAKRNLVDATYDALADHVLRSRQKVEWLPSERELAVRFGVSRPVIREATKRLELQGMVEIHHGKGTRVVRTYHRPLSQALEWEIPDPKERLRQFNEMRLILEPEAARLAAELASETDIKELRSICHRMRYLPGDDLEAAMKCDLEFHDTIARIAGNAVVRMILRALAETGAESRMATMGRVGTEKARRHHDAIAKAIESGKPQVAAKAMRFHLEEAAADLGSR